jgi:hypothetical protein
LRFEHPDRVPRDLWASPEVLAHRKTDVERVLELYPSDIAYADSPYAESERLRGKPTTIGVCTDHWQKVWTTQQSGANGERGKPPLIVDWSGLESYPMPWDLLEGADWARVNRSCAATDRFVLGVSETRPFEVMQLLRGTTQLFLDLVYQPEELFRLRDRLHEFMLRHITLWAQTDVDGIVLFDDWGSQHAMLISPKLWRAFFKPMYRDYFQAIHSAGKHVFFHSDGYIRPILDDLVEIGVDALNSQLFCMDIEEVGRTFRGRLTFWGEIDRQIILPLARGEWVRQAVRRVRRALDDGRGGVIAQCEFCHDVPKENVMAIFEAWQEPR